MDKFGTLRNAALLVGLLAGLSFIIMAVVLFMREGDWHARYLYFGFLIWAVALIGFRKRQRRTS